MNAFSLNWSNHAGYAFPPFSLVPKCLEKLRREKANLVLICPVWPAQPWFPILLELACDVPVPLHPSLNLLVSATGLTHPLLQTGSLQLAAWRLSGKISEGRDFRNHWSAYSWPETVPQHTRYMSRHGGIGWIVVSTERESLVGPYSVGLRISSGAVPRGKVL